ncbi:MAG: SRPBCC family protein [Pyrinomonadaceae bacterium]|nr:SRPBCC family protein [Pyrinomonadaceae bacterium]
MQTVEKAIEIDAPIERVFDLFSDFENFPRWMRHIGTFIIRAVATRDGLRTRRSAPASSGRPRPQPSTRLIS